MGAGRRVGTIGAVGAAAMVLTACVSSPSDQTPPDPWATPSVVVTLSRDDPVAGASCDPAVLAPVYDRACVSRTSDAGLAITTWGSSSCPRVPSDVAATTSGEVVVTITSIGGVDASCTADASPTTSVVALPDGVDPASPLTVRVTGTGIEATVQLPQS